MSVTVILRKPLFFTLQFPSPQNEDRGGRAFHRHRSWGIAVYAQSYGFIKLYDALLMRASPAALAILIGGAI
jgi:hypothetical protein